MPEGANETAFPRLSAQELDQLRPYATCRDLEPGEYIFKSGETGFSFYVILSGEIEIIEATSGEEKHVATHHPGEFTGDVDMLTGRPALVAGRASGTVEVLEMKPDQLRRIVNELPNISDKIIRAFIMRRQILEEDGVTGIRVVGSRFAADALRVREFLARNRVPHTFIDLEAKQEACDVITRLEVQEGDLPLVFLSDKEILRNPSTDELAERSGVKQPLQQRVLDVLIVGGGPAGLAAAVYGASEGLETLLIDAQAPGGQAGTSSKIENYLGFPTGLSGQDLADRALIQSEKFGAEIAVPRRAKSLDCGDGVHIVTLEDGDRVHARSVIIATGAKYKRIPADRLDEFEGRGVYYAATATEALGCVDSPVAVVGAGNSAGQAAVFLAEHASCVYLLVRGDDLRKSMSSYLASRIEQHSGIEILLNTECLALHGNDALEKITVCTKDESKDVEASGLFVLIGADPQTDWLPQKIRCDKNGFVITGPDAEADFPLARTPLYLETTCPGVFAAGDTRCGSVKRVASAVGEGAMAIAMVHRYLADA